MILANRLVIHIAGEVAHFCEASLLHSQLRKKVYKSMKQMWLSVYLDLPRF